MDKSLRAGHSCEDFFNEQVSIHQHGTAKDAWVIRCHGDRDRRNRRRRHIRSDRHSCRSCRSCAAPVPVDQCGHISAFTAVSFAQLAAFIPKEGGGYEFAHELVSPFAGFIAGWLWLLANVVIGVVVSIRFASYLQLFIPLPPHLIAPAACLVITVINYLGAKDSSLVNNILVSVKLLILVFLWFSA